MDLSRRGVLAGGLGLAATAHATPTPSPDAAALADAALFATLDATGPLEGGMFNPARALDSMAALLTLAPGARVAALERYLAIRGQPPEGLFAVIRALVQIPDPGAPVPPFPGVLHPGSLRPPALGAPVPAQPDDLHQVPRWPVVLLEDVPLVLVQGYMLGGQPEPLSMHLAGLEGATWRTEPLAPGSAGQLRYLLEHWGRWADDRQRRAMLEGQLQRLAAG